MPKVVIFTGIGSFHTPNIIAFDLIINKGWLITNGFKHYTDCSIETLYEYNSEWSFEDYYTAVYYWEHQFRTHPDVISVFEYWKPKDFKIIEIPDDIEWYIDEADDGSETIHEKHRWWG